VTIRIEVLATITCDTPGCGAEVAATGGASAAAEVAREAGWRTSYTHQPLRAVHACPEHA
jgi:hypothetical protein